MYQYKSVSSNTCAHIINACLFIVLQLLKHEVSYERGVYSHPKYLGNK